MGDKLSWDTKYDASHYFPDGRPAPKKSDSGEVNPARIYGDLWDPLGIGFDAFYDYHEEHLRPGPSGRNPFK